MKTSIELRSELTDLERSQEELKQEIAQLETRLADARKELLELEGSRSKYGHLGKIYQKKYELLQTADRESVEKSPIAQWLNPKEGASLTITVPKVTPKRIYLRGFNDKFLSDEIAFSRETGRSAYAWTPSWIDKDLILDVPATVKAWNEYVNGGAST